MSPREVIYHIKKNSSVTSDVTMGLSQERRQVGRPQTLRRRLSRETRESIWPARLEGVGISYSSVSFKFFIFCPSRRLPDNLCFSWLLKAPEFSSIVGEFMFPVTAMTYKSASRMWFWARLLEIHIFNNKKPVGREIKCASQDMEG